MLADFPWSLILNLAETARRRRRGYDQLRLFMEGFKVLEYTSEMC